MGAVLAATAGAVAGCGTSQPGSQVKALKFPTGLYVGTIDAVSPSSDQMTFTVSSSCGTPSSGSYRVDLAHATFDVNAEPSTGSGQEVTISKTDFFDLAAEKPPASQTYAGFWKSWHVLVPPSGDIDVSDGPYGSCHGAYSFLP